ncbi:MAG TPA: methyltransferase domain-containing protein, partial [Ideonella sp.]|nr:methyltransferase domain-containing protein [Ideonella sp.]
LAVALVSDQPRLAAVKAKLAAHRDSHALFDTDLFCRNLEDTLLRLHAEHGLGEVAAAVPASLAAPSTPPAPAAHGARRLLVGGKAGSPGWEALGDEAPAADPARAKDLSRFADGSFDTLHAAQVMARLDYREELLHTLGEWYRVLKPGGEIEISVPDLEVLAELILNKQLGMADRFMAMRMMFGGHMDEHDYHQSGLTQEFLGGYLSNVGFTGIERVQSFPHFRDTSDLRFAGRPIALNMRARKPAAATAAAAA